MKKKMKQNKQANYFKDDKKKKRTIDAAESRHFLPRLRICKGCKKLKKRDIPPTFLYSFIHQLLKVITDTFLDCQRCS
jgi:hypothetical protein